VTPLGLGSALGVAYLFGSVPFSYLVARQRGVDVRAVGSGNVGATNVMRAAGRAAGITAFALDALKGTAACVLGGVLDPGGPLAALAALAAVVGHIFPVWLRFRGGKGVSTALGAMAPLAPLAAGAAVATFVLVVAVSRFVSLGSILGALVMAGLTPLMGAEPVTAASVAALALLIIAKHQANILRVWRGTEPRVGRSLREGDRS
jgi:glycerol-3-phosphate acyltransferase PlsY